MKIALLLSGYIRNIDETYKIINEVFLSKYDCDIYLSTWSKIGNKISPKIYGDKNTDWINNKDKLNIEKMLKLFKPIHYEIEDLEEFNNIYDENFINDFMKKNNFTSFSRCKNVLGQFYKIQRTWLLFEKNKKKDYDIIIRSRFDFEIIKNNMNLNNLDNTSIYFSNNNFGNNNEKCDRIAVYDFFYISKNYENIKKLCNIFDWIINNSDIKSDSYILKCQGRSGPVPEFFITDFLKKIILI